MASTVTQLTPFRVQPIADANEVNMDSVEVQALGPVHAAELVLGETLSPRGSANRFRAMVWRLDERYSPISVKLFRR